MILKKHIIVFFENHNISMTYFLLFFYKKKHIMILF